MYSACLCARMSSILAVLNVLRVYMLAWFAHLSYLPYLSIIKSKKSKIEKFIWIVTINIFFCMQQFCFYRYQVEALHFEINLKEAVRSIALK